MTTMVIPPFLLLFLLQLSFISALPQFTSSPLVPGSILPPAITDPLDNGFSAPPAAGLGTPLISTNPRPLAGASVPSPPSNAPQAPTPPSSAGLGGILPSLPSLPGGLLGTGPSPTPKGNNTTVPGNVASNPSPSSNTTLPTRNSTLENIAPGTIKKDAARAAGATSPPDSGLGGLVTAGIVVASVVLASMIGIFLFRKWKLRPKGRNERWRTASNADWAAPAASSLPLHHAMQQQQHVPYYSSGGISGGGGRDSPPVAMGYASPAPPVHADVGYGGHGGDAVWQPPMHGRTVEMDLALRHHLRNG